MDKKQWVKLGKLTYQGSVRLFLQIMLPREELRLESNLLVEVQTQIPLWNDRKDEFHEFFFWQKYFAYFLVNS